MYLDIDRKVGSSEAINLRVELRVPTDLSELPVMFYLWSTNRDRTRRIETASGVSVVDLSASEDKPEWTVWKFTFQPEPGQLEWEGVHLAEFEVDYGNNQLIPYPYGRSFIRVKIRPHKGLAAAS